MNTRDPNEIAESLVAPLRSQELDSREVAAHVTAYVLVAHALICDERGCDSDEGWAVLQAVLLSLAHSAQKTPSA